MTKSLIQKPKITLWTPSQVKAWQQPHYPIKVFHGGSRAGKTFFGGHYVVKNALVFPESESLISAQVRRQLCRTLEPAVIKAMEALGVPYKFRSDEHGGGARFELPNGSKIYSSPYEGRGIDRILGTPKSLMMFDEAFHLTYEKYSLATTRLSGYGIGEIILMTNPTSPGHFIYEELIEKGQAQSNFFSVYENAGNLDNPDYIKTLELLPPAMRARFLEGKWVSSEGAVFDCFIPERNLFNTMPKDSDIKAYISGVDFGFNNAFSYVIVAVTRDDELYVCDGFEQPGMLLQQHATKIKAINSKYHRPTRIWADHDAQARHELTHLGVITEAAPKRDKLDNLMHMYTLLYTGKLKVHYSLRFLINSILGLTWKEGKDEVIKENDHAVDALCYAIAGGTLSCILQNSLLGDNPIPRLSPRTEEERLRIYHNKSFYDNLSSKRKGSI